MNWDALLERVLFRNARESCEHSGDPAECGLIGSGHATFEEWRQLTSRQAGFFNYDPEKRAYCMITIPAPWRDTPGPTWQLVAAMVRNQRRELIEKPPPRPEQQRLALL